MLTRSVEAGASSPDLAYSTRDTKKVSRLFEICCFLVEIARVTRTRIFVFSAVTIYGWIVETGDRAGRAPESGVFRSVLYSTCPLQPHTLGSVNNQTRLLNNGSIPDFNRDLSTLDTAQTSR